LKLRAPLELENLLPYNLEYRIYDKNTDQNWRSYLRKGGVMPVHSVELGHFVLLNVAIQDTGEISLMFLKLHSEKKIKLSSQAISALSTLMAIQILTLRINLLCVINKEEGWSSDSITCRLLPTQRSVQTHNTA
jgi:hypothetical protein